MKIETQLSARLLRKYIQDRNMSEKEAEEIINWNRRSGRQKSLSIILILVLCFFPLTFTWVAWIQGGSWIHSLLPTLLFLAISSHYIPKLISVVSHENVCRRLFVLAQREIKQCEKALESIVPGYADISDAAQLAFTDPDERMHYCMDWTRKYLIDLTSELKSGNGADRTKLREVFDISKKYFGHTLDHGGGYGVFFTKSIVSSMRHHTEDL